MKALRRIGLCCLERCDRFVTDTELEGGEGWRKEIGDATVRKRGQAPHKKKKEE